MNEWVNAIDGAEGGSAFACGCGYVGPVDTMPVQCWFCNDGDNGGTRSEEEVRAGPWPVYDPVEEQA